jgi:hypothetical protein
MHDKHVTPDETEPRHRPASVAYELHYASQQLMRRAALQAEQINWRRTVVADATGDSPQLSACNTLPN